MAKIELEIYDHDPELHRAGGPSAAGECAWSGQENCDAAAVYSFPWLNQWWSACEDHTLNLFVKHALRSGGNRGHGENARTRAGG